MGCGATKIAAEWPQLSSGRCMERSGVAGHHAPVSVAHLQAELAVMRARCAALETALEASASSPRATASSTPPAAGPQASAASQPAVQEEFNQAFNDSWQEWKEGKSDMDMDMDWVSLPAGHPDCVHRPHLPDARTCTVESVRRGSEEHGVRSGLSYFEYDAQRGPRSDPFAWQWKAVFVSSKFAAMMGQSDQQRTISSMNNSMNVSVPLRSGMAALIKCWALQGEYLPYMTRYGMVWSTSPRQTQARMYQSVLLDHLGLKFTPVREAQGGNSRLAQAGHRAMVSILDTSGDVRYQNHASVAMFGYQGSMHRTQLAPRGFNLLEELFHGHPAEKKAMEAATGGGNIFNKTMQIKSPLLQRWLDITSGTPVWHQIQVGGCMQRPACCHTNAFATPTLLLISIARDPVTLKNVYVVAQVDVTSAVLTEHKVNELQAENNDLAMTAALLEDEKTRVQLEQEAILIENERLKVAMAEMLDRDRDNASSYHNLIDDETPADKAINLCNKILVGEKISPAEAAEVRDVIIRAGSNLLQPVDIKAQIMGAQFGTNLDKDVGANLLNMLCINAIELQMSPSVSGPDQATSPSLINSLASIDPNTANGWDQHSTTTHVLDSSRDVDLLAYADRGSVHSQARGSVVLDETDPQGSATLDSNWLLGLSKSHAPQRQSLEGDWREGAFVWRETLGSADWSAWLASPTGSPDSWSPGPSSPASHASPETRHPTQAPSPWEDRPSPLQEHGLHCRQHDPADSSPTSPHSQPPSERQWQVARGGSFKGLSEQTNNATAKARLAAQLLTAPDPTLQPLTLPSGPAKQRHASPAAVSAFTSTASHHMPAPAVPRRLSVLNNDRSRDPLVALRLVAALGSRKSAPSPEPSSTQGPAPPGREAVGSTLALQTGTNPFVRPLLGDLPKQQQQSHAEQQESKNGSHVAGEPSRKQPASPGQRAATAFRYGVSAMIKLIKSPSDHLAAVLASAEVFSWDPFALSTATDDHPLSVLVFALLKRHHPTVLKACAVDDVKLCRFLIRVGALGSRVSASASQGTQALLDLRLQVEEDYPNNPYHCRTHAADVVHSLHMLLTQAGVLTSLNLGDAGTLAAYLAAAVHDVQHKGLNNDFLIKSSDKLALLYNDISPMENHHLATTFTLLSQEPLNFLARTPRKMFDAIRKVMINMVLATDMRGHFSSLSLFKSKLHLTDEPNASIVSQRPSDSGYGGHTVAGGFHPNKAKQWTPVPPQLLADEEIRSLVLSVALKCADIGHLAAQPEVHRRWVLLLEEELFRQGDKEAALGLPVSALMDRSKAGITKSQVRHCLRAPPNSHRSYGESSIPLTPLIDVPAMQTGFLNIVALPLFKAMAKVSAAAANKSTSKPNINQEANLSAASKPYLSNIFS
ncbi:hypothetical protein QJQ45_017984 [Haematococcus lacustris]|nr:hypothetical protein QJQ45_017984 [Haematococcus lacustris]